MQHTNKTGLMALIFAVAALAPGSAQAEEEILDLVSCPNSDNEVRSGNAQCVFTCGGSDTLFVSADADQTLERITGKGECGGAVAECVEANDDACSNDSNALTTRAQNEGACKATGVDPWWAGQYSLTADCWSEWDPNADPSPLCLVLPDCGAGVHMQATIVDGRVVDVIGKALATGQTFVPVVLVEETVDGIAITIST